MATELGLGEVASTPSVSTEFIDFYGRVAELLEDSPAPRRHNVLLDTFTASEPLSIHRLATRGVQKGLARLFSGGFQSVPRHVVLRVIGVSERTLQRADEDDLLSPDSSDRLLRLAAVTEQAIDVLGSQEAAEAWLERPAIGLDRNRPIDLIASSEGTEAVKTLLKRMDYEVYA